MLSFAAIICLATGFAQVNSQFGGWGDRLAPLAGNLPQLNNPRFGNLADKIKQQAAEFKPAYDPNSFQKYWEDPQSLLDQVKQRTPELQQYISKAAPNAEELQKFRQTFEDLKNQRLPRFEPSKIYERFNKNSQDSDESKDSSEETVKSRAI